MTTATDFPDWTQPVGIVDHSVAVSNGPVNAPVWPAYAEYDTARYAAVILLIKVPVDLTPLEYALVAQWTEAGIDTTSDVITFWSPGGGGGNTPTLVAILPAKGATVRLSSISNGANTPQVTPFVSTRSPAGPTVKLAGSNSGAFLADTGNVNVPASGNVQMVTLFPVGATLGMAFSSTSSKVYLSGTALVVPNNAMGTAAMGFLQPTPGALLANPPYTEVPAPLVATQWTATNTDTAAHLARLAVYDLS